MVERGKRYQEELAVKASELLADIALAEEPEAAMV